MRMAALLAANALMLVSGLGLLPLLGIARSWRLLLFRSGLRGDSPVLTEFASGNRTRNKNIFLAMGPD